MHNYICLMNRESPILRNEVTGREFEGLALILCQERRGQDAFKYFTALLHPNSMENRERP